MSNPSQSSPSTSAIPGHVPGKCKGPAKALLDKTATATLEKSKPDKAPLRKAKPCPSNTTPPHKAQPPVLRPITKGTKQAKLVALLQRKAGVSVAHISQRLGWQAHTARAALSALRKRGLVIERVSRPGKASLYHIRPKRQKGEA